MNYINDLIKLPFISDSENESFIDFVINDAHLLVVQSTSLNLSSETVVDEVPAVLCSETVVDEVPAVLSQSTFDTSTIVLSSNIESDSLTLPALSNSNEKKKL